MNLTITARTVSLSITGAPDLPNRYGSGSIRPSEIDLTYRGSSVRAHLYGRWRRADGELTDAPASQPYNGPLADWPDWLADIARKYTPESGVGLVPDAGGESQ